MERTKRVKLAVIVGVFWGAYYFAIWWAIPPGYIPLYIFFLVVSVLLLIAFAQGGMRNGSTRKR